jgi:hypothetical protein
MNKRAVCRTCGADFGTNFLKLAVHILGESRSTHRYGRRWAAKVVHLKPGMKKRKEYGNSDSPDKIREPVDVSRKLTGQEEIVKTLCLRGKHIVTQRLPVEFTRDPHVWRKQGYLVVACQIHS